MMKMVIKDTFPPSFAALEPSGDEVEVTVALDEMALAETPAAAAKLEDNAEDELIVF